MKFKKNIVFAFTILLLSIVSFNYFTEIDSKGLPFSDNTLGGLIQIAMAEEGTESGDDDYVCFKLKKTDCGKPFGGDKVTCDPSGNYKQGEQCTEVPCGILPVNKITCTQPT